MVYLPSKAPENRPGPQKERIVFQASVLMGEMLASGRVCQMPLQSIQYTQYTFYILCSIKNPKSKPKHKKSTERL